MVQQKWDINNVLLSSFACVSGQLLRMNWTQTVSHIGRVTVVDKCTCTTKYYIEMNIYLINLR